MSDQFTEIETTGYFQRIINSFVGILIGILLFLGSFVLLYWNEGRIDPSQVAKASIEIPATGSPSVAIGDFISVTGTLTSEEQLGDSLFLVPGDYIALRRKSEMYAWEEETKKETKRNVGGSETRTTTYSYRKSWEEEPENSASFKKSNGHENPPKEIASQTFRVSQAKIGQYNLNLQSLQFPTPSPVTLNSNNLVPQSRATLTEDYLFMGNGSLQSPVIGDIRIQYTALNKGIQATVLGQLSEGNAITAYRGPRNIVIYRLFPGTRAQAIATLSTEHKVLTWVLRGVGFLIMWIGMGLIIEPLNVLLDVLPFFGNLSRGATGFVTFVSSLVLSILTILTSIILHNPIMVFLAIGLSAFALLWFWRRKSTASG